MRGSLFINFLALIITAHITQIMTEKNIFKKSTKAKLFKTLNKLKVFQLANSKQLLAKVTAKGHGTAKRDLLCIQCQKLSPT